MLITTRRKAVAGLLWLAGCTSTQVTSVQPYEGQKLPRPGRIIVHDFVADLANLPAGSPLAARAASA
jgi:hypothetical protein